MTLAAIKPQITDHRSEIRNDRDEPDLGQSHLSHRQHGQLGPTSPATPTQHAGQCDCPDAKGSPDLKHDEPDLEVNLQQVREHQQIDLAMLRLAFRSILFDNCNPGDDGQPAPSPLRQVSCSELNQLVSAVVRLHGDERELLGIQPPENVHDNDQQYDYLEQLSTPQLIELCYKEGINPPDTCKTLDQTQNTTTTSQT